MLFLGGTVMMTEEQEDRWNAVLAGLAELSAVPSDDPWMFHGTSQDAARRILRDGFDPSTSWVFTDRRSGGPGHVQPAVFWTSDPEIAGNYAAGKSGLDAGFPVVLVARLSSVLASGVPLPDLNIWQCNHDGAEDRRPRDWRHSLEIYDGIAVLECRNVPGLAAAIMESWDARPDPQVAYAKIEAGVEAARVRAEDPVAPAM